MRTCEHCGFDANRDTARFCTKCGQPLGGHTLLPEGTVLNGRYRVVEVLGQGGMGAVYLVSDEGLYGKQWALKELLESFNNPQERREAIDLFHSEVQMLVGLHHPNLPQVIDFFEQNGRHYLVMEYIEGRTLKEIMKAAPQGYLSEKQIENWIVQICDVLEYLHHHDPPIVFRDLKPANIMITPENEVKLIDFGVARLFDPAKGTDTLRMGTVGYAPPEQYAGKGQTSPLSDIYALGATLYELLTGDSPEDHPFVFHPPRQVNRKISPKTARAIEKATNLKPEERFTSIRAMRSVLLERKRTPVILGLAGASLLVLLCVIGASLLIINNIPWQADTPTEPVEAIAAQPSTTPTRRPRPTSTLAPTLTPEPDTPTPTAEPTATASPTETPALTPTEQTENTSPTATSESISPVLPTPGDGDLGSIIYTIDADGSYYLASASPNWSQGQVIDPTSYGLSTCAGRSTAETVTGDPISLYYGYRCQVLSPGECVSPLGDYKVVLWSDNGIIYSLSTHQVSDNSLVHAVYTGHLNDDEPIIWAPDGSYFYFTIDHTLHRSSPYTGGYEPVLPIAYQPYISPDSSMILYLQPVGVVGAYDIWVANADGTAPRNVTNSPETDKMCARWRGY